MSGMVSVNANDLAGKYLQALGAPNTQYNRNVLMAWMVHETGAIDANGNISTHGYNALNWSIGATHIKGLNSGTWSNGIVFPTYDSADAAAVAFTDVIQHNGSNYSAIESGLKGQNDPIAAIVNSPWGGWDHVGKYAGGISGLTASFNQMVEKYGGSGKLGGGGSGTSPLTTTTNIIGTILNSFDAPSGGGAGGSTDAISLFNGDLTFPKDRPMTEADVNKIMDYLGNHKQADGKPLIDIWSIEGGIAQKAIHDILMKHVGEPWSDSLVKTIQSDLAADAASLPTIDSTGLGGIGASLGNLGSAIATIGGKIVPISAIALGVVFILFGGYIVYRSSSDNPISVPTPV